jgi:hypothetical protein
MARAMYYAYPKKKWLQLYNAVFTTARRLR